MIASIDQKMILPKKTIAQIGPNSSITDSSEALLTPHIRPMRNPANVIEI